MALSSADLAPGEVLAHIEEICTSPPFLESQKCQQFLRYVAESTVEGRTDLLKERLIGAHLYQRPADYDTAEDAIVRVRANEVRRRLAQYYETAPGKSRSLRVSIPAGAYLIKVESAPPLPAVEKTAPPPSEPMAPPAGRASGRRLRVASVVVFAVAVPLVAWMLFRPQAEAAALGRFWAPFLNTGHPVLLCTGSIRYYYLSPELRRRLEQRSPKPPASSAEPGPEWALENTRLVSKGNFHASSYITAHLSRQGARVQVRVGNDLSMEELASHPIILLGAFSNPFSMEFNRDLRFHFVRTVAPDESSYSRIEDRDRPGQAWSTPDYPNRIDHDFALVTRIRQPRTGRYLVIAGGITEHGTQVAGDFVVDESSLAALTKGLPADWDRKNLQVLLRTNLVNGTPTVPTVVAYHVW
ncbi:MAG TPA: hypothetical protein DEH78_21795 [Solibacterales bacterium]|nr:hypothetical protein [Bryobacterales bacterium]